MTHWLISTRLPTVRGQKSSHSLTPKKKGALQ